MDSRSQSGFCARQETLFLQTWALKALPFSNVGPAVSQHRAVIPRSCLLIHQWLCMRGRPQPCLVSFSSIGSFLVTALGKKFLRLFCKILWNNSGELWATQFFIAWLFPWSAHHLTLKECFTGCRLPHSTLGGYRCSGDSVVHPLSSPACVLAASSFFLAFLLCKLRDTVLTSHSGPTWWKMLLHLSSSPFETDSVNFC